MQGIYINDGRPVHKRNGANRPTSKKEVKELIKSNPELVSVEATSFFGNEYGGPVLGMPDGEIHFVGPNPHTVRNFYGTITKAGDQISVR